MSLFPGPANPVVYAQYVIQGRWPRMLTASAVYWLLMAGAMWLAYIANPHPTSQDMQAYIGILAGLQAATLLVFGSFRIEQAVRGDITSRMIESHRLMPASALGAILGYLFGSPLQAYLLAAVNFITGVICCMVGGLPVGPWVLANAAFLYFAVFVHALIMQFAFVNRGGFVLLLFGGFLLIPTGASGALEMIPSLSVLLFPMISRWSVFAQLFSTTPGGFSSQLLFSYAAAFIAQAIVISVAIRVSLRRYCSSAVVGISPALGLIVLGTWVALALAGFGLPDQYGYIDRYRSFDNRAVAQTVSSFTSAMLLAMIPIASAARLAQGRQSVGELSGQRSKAIFSELWTLIAALAITGLLLANIVHAVATVYKTCFLTMFVVANFFLAIACIFSHGYARRGRPWIIVTFWVILTWIVPVIADGIYHAMANVPDNATMLTTFSPPGALALIWSDSPVDLKWGIMGQVVLTLLAAGLFLAGRTKRRAKSALAIRPNQPAIPTAI